MTTRRTFLRTTSLAALAASVGSARGLDGQSYDIGAIDAHPRPGHPDLRELAMRAIDTARAAGATYADVRLTLTREQSFFYGGPPFDTESAAVGVRALTNGAWGFVSSSVWTDAEMARLGAEAVLQAKANTWRDVRPVELAPLPQLVVGEWRTPIERDPFTVSIAEKLDYLRAAESHVRTFRHAHANSAIKFTRQDNTFASTDGSFVQQTFYRAFDDSSFSIVVTDPIRSRGAVRNVPLITPMGGGYEVFERIKLLDAIPAAYEEAVRQLNTVSVGNSRYDIVFDAMAMAQIINGAIGTAFELDRALGYEANATGTTYLSPPDRVLGETIASSLLNIVGERSSPDGVATAQWDDDGVEPQTVRMIENGVAVDYATNREQAGVLSRWYASRDMPPASRGCARAADGAMFPLIRTPNLVMEPRQGQGSFHDLVAQVSNGLAIVGGECRMDQQRVTGQGFGEVVYRIRNGKLGSAVGNASYLVRIPEFLKKIAVLGGPESVMSRGCRTWKGQPAQAVSNTVRAVAALVKDQIVVDSRTSQWTP